MADIYNSIAITRTARTILDILDLPGLDGAAEGIPFVVKVVAAEAKTPIRRAVIYNADAVGMHIIQKYTGLFYPVFENTRVSVPVRSTVESVTPAAHASMYSGLAPEKHGIKTYVRPQLVVDTIFDVLLAAGRHPAIVCMPDSSFVHIFAGRAGCPIFEEKNNADILEKVEELLKGGEYDFISVHTFEYDDAAHVAGPESKFALDAAKREVDGFGVLCDSIRKYWGDEDVLVAYLPDHGQHLMEPWEPNPSDDVGNHGSIRTEDMNVMHYYGLIRR